MKKLFLWMTLLAVLLGFSAGFTVEQAEAALPAGKKQTSVVDAANVLKPVDKQKLTVLIRELEEKHKIRIAAITVNGTQGMSVPDYANQILDTYYQDGQVGNILMLVDMKSRHWQIVTDPKMRKMITDKGGVDRLKASFLGKLKDGDYAAAFTNYAKDTAFMVEYYQKEGKAYDPANEFSGGALAGGGAIALGLAALFRKILEGQMSNVRPAAGASAYLNKDSFTLTGSNDTYLYTTTAVIPKKRNNEGNERSGGSSGGNGGGGGSF